MFNARLPARFRGRVGDGMQPEDIRETVVPITVNRLWGTDLDISDQDLTMVVERFGERYGEGAAETIANKIDGEILDRYVDFFNAVGTPGTVPTNLDTYGQARVAMLRNGTPANKDLTMLVDPLQELKVLGFQANFYNPAKTISEQYLTGRMGVALGMKWDFDQNMPNHTVGATTGSTPIVTTANQSGNSIATSGWTVSTTVLVRGDIFSITGCYAVNPISYRTTNVLRTFVVLADVASDGSGLATITFAPDLNATGPNSGDPNNPLGSPFQTVSALPAANAPIFVYGTAAGAAMNNISGAVSTQALGFHKEAITVAMVKLEKPGGMEWSEIVSSPRFGVSIRLVRGYDIRTNRKYTRFDVLGGIKTVRPEMGCRVCG